MPLASAPAQSSEAGLAPLGDASLVTASLSLDSDALPVHGTALPQLPSILVIEDNADMREYLRQVLAEGYDVSFAGDGDSGLAIALRDIPDLVVCDIMLPGRDGYEVCQALKTDDRTSHVPVILLTALEGTEHRLKGLAERADDYLVKPFDEAELRQRIANLLELRSLLQRRFARAPSLEAPPPELGPREQAFLQKLARVADEQHAYPGLDLAGLASAMAVSERGLQRKLRALVGMSPGEYLREFRLERAMARLRAGERPGEVAFATGFASQAHFSSCFRARYGHSPSEVRERQKAN